LQNWENLKKDPSFPKEILSGGVPLEVFLTLKNIKDFIGMNILVQLENAIDGSESLLRNVTFGMSIGNDEIGFRLRVFRENGIMTSIKQSVPVSSDIWIIGGMIVMILFLGVMVIVVHKNRSEEIPTAETIIDKSPIVSNMSEKVQETPNENNSLPLETILQQEQVTQEETPSENTVDSSSEK